MSSCQFVLKTAMPASIAVADKPLNLGGQIEYLSTEEFQNRFGIVYNDGISIDSKTRISRFDENITGEVSTSQLKRQVEKVLKATCKNLVICNMGKFGYGVFALKNIPKNTVVVVYAGTILNSLVSNSSDHALRYYGTNMAFSTEYHRGIGSFMQHLPTEPKVKDARTLSLILKMCGQDVSEEQLKLEDELYSTEFESADVKSLLATENIRKEYLNINNFPLIAMVTNKDVKAGDQLGFNYGYDYWRSRNITPEFFDKNGNQLPHSTYKKTFGQLNFENFTYTGEFKPLINSLNKGQTSVKILGDDKKTHDVRVSEVVYSLLSVNGCRVKINPLYAEMLSQ